MRRSLLYSFQKRKPFSENSNIIMLNVDAKHRMCEKYSPFSEAVQDGDNAISQQVLTFLSKHMDYDDFE